jgi:hypothetical protein
VWVGERVKKKDSLVEAVEGLDDATLCMGKR